MKKRILTLIMGVLILMTVSACSGPSGGTEKNQPPEETADWELHVIAAYGSGTSLPEETSFEKASLLMETDGWGYYMGVLSYEGQTFAAVWRTRGEEVESLCSIHQPQGEGPKHTIAYQLGAEDTGGQFLYFTIQSGVTGEKSLWVLEIQTLTFAQMYTAPCSNLVLPRELEADWQGLGWVVYDHYLIPVDLDQGSEYTAGIQDLTQSPVLGKDGAARQVELADAGNSQLALILSPGTDQEEQITVNYATGALSR